MTGNVGNVCSIPFSLFGATLATVLHDRLIYTWADNDGNVHVQIRPIGLLEPMVRGWLDYEKMLVQIANNTASADGNMGGHRMVVLGDRLKKVRMFIPSLLSLFACKKDSRH